MPKLALIIPTRNRQALLCDTIRSLQDVAVPAGWAVELIVVANACTDETAAAATAALKSLAFPGKVVIDDVPGAGHGRNCGMRATNADFIIFLDDDIFARLTLITGHVRGFTEFGADIVAGRVTRHWAAGGPPDWFDPRLPSIPVQVEHGEVPKAMTRDDFFASANLGFRRAKLPNGDLFKDFTGSSGRPVAAHEETAAVLRLLRDGARMFYMPEAAILHRVPDARIDPKATYRRTRDTGYAYVLMRQSLGEERPRLRLLISGARLIKGHVIAFFSAAVGNRRNVVYHRAMANASLGAFQAAWNLVRCPSPAARCLGKTVRPGTGTEKEA